MLIVQMLNGGPGFNSMSPARRMLMRMKWRVKTGSNRRRRHRLARCLHSTATEYSSMKIQVTKLRCSSLRAGCKMKVN
jgi:hypothetical protein